MSKEQLNVRLPDSVIAELDKKAEEDGMTKTAIVNRAISNYLDIDCEDLSIENLSNRIDYLEEKINRMESSRNNVKNTKNKIR